jgi:hypothetical protein
MRTRNLILLVFVTAALVIPSGYIMSIELDSHSQKTLPPIYTNGTLYSSSWRGNFSALTSTIPYLFNINESTTFHQPGFQNSTLNVSLSYFQIYYFMHKGSFQIALNFNYSSIMHLSSFPVSLDINQTLSVPFANPSFPPPYTFTDWSADGIIEQINNVGRATSTYDSAGWQGPQVVIPLLNTSEAAAHDSYRFFVAGSQFGPDIFNTVNNVTYTYGMNVSLIGLSRPVYINMVVNFTNTNVPSDPVTIVNSSSPNNHAAHAAGMDSGSFRGSTHPVKDSSPRVISGFL